MKKYLLFSIFSLVTFLVASQELTKEETHLYQLIMAYRAEKGLPSIPLSTSLTVVAKTHAKDLSDNTPDAGTCNMHSWSTKGNWTPCCYLPDHSQAQCMWKKPSELTSYNGNGYEIAYWTGDDTANAKGALARWKSSSGHNAVIINEGIWKSRPWQAIGIGIYGKYAVVWFGEQKDAN